MMHYVPVNSLPPEWRHMVTKILVNTGSDNGLLPDSTKPLHEPMLTQDYWHPFLHDFIENKICRLSLIQVMAWYHSMPTHYLNQWWLIVNYTHGIWITIQEISFKENLKKLRPRRNSCHNVFQSKFCQLCKYFPVMSILGVSSLVFA